MTEPMNLQTYEPTSLRAYEPKNLSEDKSSPVNCLICNAANHKLLFQSVQDLEYETYKPVDYIVCRICGLISQHPLPDKSQLKDFYPFDYRNYLPVEENIFSKLKSLQFKSLAKKLSSLLNKKDAKILEIGFGNGQLLLALQELGYKNLYGTDFTDRVFLTLQHKGIKLEVSNVEEKIPFNEKFDLIIMNNVIEHFLLPDKVLASCKGVLSNSGKVVLITPNSKALEFLIFKKYWAGFHAPRHTFIFNSSNIKMLGDKLGYSKIKVDPIVDPGQLSISIQNMFQDSKITKTNLKNGMSWYLMLLSLSCAPLAMIENLIGKSTSMLCMLEK